MAGMALRSWIFVPAVFQLINVCLTANSPHIIVILADDLGWNDVSFHGSQQIPTPNIDALANNGIILNNYYVSPICSPSRSALMTGKHPIHTGMQHDVIYGAQPYGLPLSEKLLPQYLKELGYKTHIVGKWHLGFFKEKYTPLYRGFDSHAGYYCGHQDYFDHTALENPHYWGFDMRQNSTLWKEANGQYTTELFTEKALDVINNHNSTAPLFLYLAHLAVHSGNNYDPLQALPEDVKDFGYINNINRRTFAGMLKALDRSVGKVTDLLEHRGMLNNSIIVFSTDNGGPANGFNQNAASNWPLRGTKDTLWEGGVRGSSCIWSPLLKNPLRVSQQMMHISDWLPTLYHAAGGNVKYLPRMDGIDMWDALSLNLQSPRKEILHNIDDILKIAALRVGDFKVVIGRTYGGTYDGWYPPWQVKSEHDEEVRNGQKLLSNIPQAQRIHEMLGNLSYPNNADKSKLNNPHSPQVVCGPIPANASTSCQPQLKPCLFNIKDDPCEFYNVADKFPNVLAQLLQRLQQYNETAVPPANKPDDPLSNPRLHGYNWMPWKDDTSRISEYGIAHYLN